MMAKLIKSFGLLLLLLPHLLYAEGMKVDADNFELVQALQRAIFTGHVVAVRDNMTIKADKMTLWYQQDAESGKKTLERAKAVGNVYFLTQDSEGEADEMSFDVGSDVLVLKGQARMKSAQGTIRGEHIIYDSKSKDTKVLKGDSEQQVHFIFNDAEGGNP